MIINLKQEMDKANKLLELHQKTKHLLIVKINEILKALESTEVQSKLKQKQIEKIKAKAKEILSYLNK